ncbi:MAG: type 1 pili tip component [Pseudomonadota bacterium]
MRVSELIQHWSQRSEAGRVQEVTVALGLEDAAKIEALAEMFAAGDARVILRDLIHAALLDVEAGFGYVPGERVVERDEQDDPIYEDAGPTPRFVELKKRHFARLQGE